LWQAFLIQMDHFDRLLEIGLARMLDPIVNGPTPPRRWRRTLTALHLVPGGISALPADMAVIAEPVPVAIPAQMGTPVS